MTFITAAKRPLLQSGLLAAAGLVFIAGCSSSPAKAPEVASIATPGSIAASTASTAPTGDAVEAGRPRHRVDETPEDSQKLIAPWTACMKAHGADMDQQPNSIAGAEAWSAAHADAGKACLPKLPLLPWGEDSANPAHKDNLHKWVQCMTSQGMSVVETPDDSESPWHFGDGKQPPNSDKIEQTCEVQVMGPSDK
ncbi:MAG: putative secreted protein [Amycolatopsis sp.]|uniref:hypothetical protein n=1 Tax=Amycolatopsis sp. TaxID=37632 RepID=UPI00262BD227|nr:hypothetical protein [Amycolatopsis sp.]MCU1683369.1 putative secreted protein [Amycolatopsis sp.]